MGWSCGQNGITLECFNILTVKPTVKKPLRRLGRRCEDIIRKDRKETGVSTSIWVDSVRDRDYWIALVNVTLNLRVFLTHGVS